MKKFILPITLALVALLAVSILENWIRIPQYISKREISATVNAVADSLAAHYVFPEKGKAMAEALRSELRRGQFDVSSPRSLALEVNRLLKVVGNDPHLVFFFDSRISHDLREPGRKTMTRMFFDMEKEHQFFIFPIQWMRPDVACLRLDQMVEPSHVGDRLNRIFDSLRGAGTVILDLRHNGGGSPEMVQRILSAFYRADTSVHLNDNYSQRTGHLTAFWTMRETKGARLPTARLMVLTSAQTASAAEELAYDVQNLHRGLVIGETTAGGAHSGDMVSIANRFAMFLPDGYSLNPYSGKNWERTGVVPDVNVPADSALSTALTRIDGR